MPNLSRLYEIDTEANIDAATMDLKEVRPERTLAELLESMRQAEDDLETFDVDLSELGANIREKVDGIAEYLQHCDQKATALRERMKAIEKKAKAFENRSKNLKQHVANLLALDAEQKGPHVAGLNAKGKHRISGEAYQISLQFHDYVEIIGDPNPVAFLKLGPSFIERRYTWDKRALKMALENNSKLVSEFAEIKKRPHVKIDVRT